MNTIATLWVGGWFCVYLCLGNPRLLRPNDRTLTEQQKWVIGWWNWLMNFRYLVTPWKSEYIRWRMLTVFRTDEELTAREFWTTAWRHRTQFWHWMKWHREMRRHA